MSFFIYHRGDLERKNFLQQHDNSKFRKKGKKIGAFCFGYHVSRLSQIVTDKNVSIFFLTLFCLGCQSHTHSIGSMCNCSTLILETMKKTQNVSHGVDNFTIPQPYSTRWNVDNGKMSFCGLSDKRKKCFSIFTFGLIFQLRGISTFGGRQTKERERERRGKMLCVSADNETIRH